MTEPSYEAVTRSFRRARNKQLAESFYQRFLAADYRIQSLFANTNFTRQKELFLHGVFSLLEYAQGKAVGELAIRRLGMLHSRKRLNISPDMYAIWVDCLIQSLWEKDPQFSASLEQEWRSALQKGIDRMIAML